MNLKEALLLAIIFLCFGVVYADEATPAENMKKWEKDNVCIKAYTENQKDGENTSVILKIQFKNNSNIPIFVGNWTEPFHNNIIRILSKDSKALVGLTPFGEKAKEQDFKSLFFKKIAPHEEYVSSFNLSKYFLLEPKMTYSISLSGGFDFDEEDEKEDNNKGGKTYAIGKNIYKIDGIVFSTK